MKKGFTMIELIFVIVILGILAAVAIPKLMATRTDAKISAISQETSNIISEIPAYVTSQGKVDDITTMSQVAATMVQQGQASEENNGSTLVIKTPDDNGDLEDCIQIDVNSTTMSVSDLNTSTGAVCAGVQQRIKAGDYTIAGSNVKF